MKKYWFCLLLISSFCVPLSAEEIQYTNIPFATAQHPYVDSSQHKEANHPPKKSKKSKRGNILNKKHKMRNGHTCPSF